MGITDFYKSIRTKYPKAFKPIWHESYDHVYIDINCALHMSSIGAQNVDDIYGKLIKFMDGVIQEVIPTKSLVVCTDGSAPLSKLMLQRKRRLMKVKDDITNMEISSLIFTPSTEFMTNLKNKLSKYLKFIGQLYSIKVDYLDPDIDEAELKLKYAMDENIKNNNKDSHVIVTNDADVVVMLTSLSDYTNAFVFQKSHHQNETLSIGKLMDLHTEEVGTSLNPGLDFIGVNIMLGNDYIPKVKFGTFDKIWNAYRHALKIQPTGLILNDKIQINRKFLILMMEHFTINTMKKFINDIDIKSFDKSLNDNYFDGFTWCVDMYNRGLCDRYNYMYANDDGPSPCGIIHAALYDNKYFTLINEKFPPLSPVLYSILMLPKAAIDLIDEKYHKLIKQSDILYEEESCKQCKNYDIALKKLGKDISDEKKKLTKEFYAHKKSHKHLTLDTIIDITKSFNKIK